ncbi:MAG: glycerol-3-phosphate acyltransferase [Rhodobacteraceae bacterium]|nr:glycerol-3-phosphate acyltransferase [Paracoccaceae bacterium]
MFQTVTLPLWLLVLILAFAAVTFASHFLFPSVRWFFRRRMERVVAKLNERLERPIQPFKLARRTDMIQRLLYDPTVIEAVAAHAAETGVREDVAFQQAKRYAREIVPAFSATAYFGFAIRFARWLSTRLFHVRLGHHDEAGLAGIDKDATIVFVMNHRSNMDYVLVTYLAAERSALSYAVGEWARIWPLQSLIRAMGAYFIRRRSRNALYRRVLARYVQLATAAGVAQAVFPEGGLSLNGKVGTPRLGILNYIISEFNPANRDVVFVPVAINYDRVIEDRILIEAEKAGERRFRGTLVSGALFTARYIWRRITGKAQRFGYASVSFGEPLSLTSFQGRTDKDLTASVGAELMARIRRVVPVLPVPLMALFMRGTETPLSRDTLIARTEAAIETLTRAGTPASINGGSPPEIVDAGLRHLEMRHIVKPVDGGFLAAADADDVLAFYSASIEHLLDASAATAPEDLPQIAAIET